MIKFPCLLGYIQALPPLDFLSADARFPQSHVRVRAASPEPPSEDHTGECTPQWRWYTGPECRSPRCYI